MPQLRPSNIRRDRDRRTGFLSEQLPFGSLKRHIVMRGVVPLLILILIVLIFDNVVMPIVTRHGDEFPLPDLTGQRLMEAQLVLDDLHLRYEVASEEFAPGKPAGEILGQIPIGGTEVKIGRTIKFVVSLGEKMVAVPDVAGLSVRQARLDLETAGLSMGDITWAFSDTLPEKVVVLSYPPPGTEITSGSPVTLMVNRGRFADFTYMPQLVGLHLDVALKKLEEKSLKAGVITRRLDDSYLPQTVLEQSEPEGAELDPGTEIDLVVSTLN
ncbi:MAG TPA: PASTA domain-containing protein [candidate division Zixibacteria bacterium]|nr:PASTA domain-containing protein [candidate division Zixibacteria bacterium]